MTDIASWSKRCAGAFHAARPIFPGVAASATVAMAAGFVSDHHGGPRLLYALLLGMAFSFLSRETSAAAGISFTASTILRIGVALLGVRISAAQIAELGWLPVAIVVTGVVSTIGIGALLSRPLGLSLSQGVLSGGSVAICGASAALAISSVLPRDRRLESDTIFTVIAVTTASTVAMIVYPLIVQGLGFSDYQAGILLGGTIHDVAQVVGAGHLISDQAEAVATYVKLLRVAMLMPTVLLLALLFAKGAARTAAGVRAPLPLFLIGFAFFATANSFELIPQPVSAVLSDVSRWCLVFAIAALGMKTVLRELVAVGWRPLALVVAETLYLLGFVLLALIVWP